jgi:hypothetical protein
MILIFVLTLADDLCCAWIIYPILCFCWCPEKGTSSTDWAQLIRFHLKTETEFGLRNSVLNNKGRWIMSKNIVILLIYLSHKILDSISDMVNTFGIW